MSVSRKTEKCSRGVFLKAELCEMCSIISHFKQIKAEGVCGFCTHWVCSCAKVFLIPSFRNTIVFGLACEMKAVGEKWHKKNEHM